MYRITTMTSPMERGARRLWIEIIAESSVLYAVAPFIPLVYYSTGDVYESFPMVVATMITVSFGSVLFLLGANMSSSGFGIYPDRRSGIERCDEAPNLFRRRPLGLVLWTTSNVLVRHTVTRNRGRLDSREIWSEMDR